MNRHTPPPTPGDTRRPPALVAAVNDVAPLPPSGYDVLVVDDERINRVILAKQVGQMGHAVSQAGNGREALDHLRAKRFDLVLLDVVMPELDGLQLLEIMRDDPDLQRVPVVVVSSSEQIATAVSCIEAGAEDFVTKPFDPVLLRARIVATLEKKRLRDGEAQNLRQLLDLQQRLEERNRDLEALNLKLAEQALTDALTGLPNRRFAMEQLHRLWASCARHGRTLAVLVIDVDHFKRVNDTFGHDGGDAVLCQVAGRLRGAVRSEEVVCRLGGEEFLVLAEPADVAAAARCAERLRRAVAATPIVVDGQPHAMTVSVGVAVRDENAADHDQLLKRADRALYRAKAAGRDRVCVG